MSRSNLALYGGAMSAVACCIGVWFWQHEADYAAKHPNTELADQLQWVGVAIALLGATGVLLAIAVTRKPDE